MTEDQVLITDIVKQVVSQMRSNQVEVTVPVGVSARHVHISKEDLKELFGEDSVLHEHKGLMGGQYAAKEKVTLVGANLRVIENVRILGPERNKTQVELAQTDAFKLGVRAPVRASGDIEGSASITLVGPKGSITLEEGCIVARRHIHMNTEDAKKLGFTDKQIVSVMAQTQREGILKDVQIRVDPTFDLEMHIDTDEANALGIGRDATVKILR